MAGMCKRGFAFICPIIHFFIHTYKIHTYMWDQCYSSGYCGCSKIFINVFYIHTLIHTLIYRTYMQVTPDANPINPRKFREEALKRFHDQLPEHLRPKEEG